MPEKVNVPALDPGGLRSFADGFYPFVALAGRLFKCLEERLKQRLLDIGAVIPEIPAHSFPGFALLRIAVRCFLPDLFLLVEVLGGFRVVNETGQL